MGRSSRCRTFRGSENLKSNDCCDNHADAEAEKGCQSKFLADIHLNAPEKGYRDHEDFGGSQFVGVCEKSQS